MRPAGDMRYSSRVEPKVLLAGGDFRPRALILGQLQEEGFDVTAVETWDEAELLLRQRAVRPDAVVFDVEGELHPDAALATLARLVVPTRALILTSASGVSAADARRLGFDHVLARPYSVRDVIETLAALLGVPGQQG
jgi:DNA-binding response OmpR family regulator